MQERNNMDKRIEDTLNSLDGMQRAEPNPFIYTRIQARLHQSKSTLERLVIVAGKPAFALIILVVVLSTNLMVMLNGKAELSAVNQTQTQLAVADEYHLNVPTLYDYETPEP